MHPDPAIYQETNVNREGLSVTTCAEWPDGEVTVKDESWWTWAEIELLMEEHRDV